MDFDALCHVLADFWTSPCWCPYSNKTIRDEDEESYMCPFPEQGPCIYDELNDMIHSCHLCGPLTEWRRRQGQSALQFPVTHATLYKGIMTFDQDCPALDAIRPLFRFMARDKHRQLIVLEDGNDESVSYMMELDLKNQRIVLTFHAPNTSTLTSSSTEDWNMPLHTQPLHQSTRYSAYIHSLLHHYLFESSSKTSTGGLSVYQHILQNYVKPLLTKYPQFRLYATGYGMGGALATVWGVKVAQELHYATVSIVSVAASPYGGDGGFAQWHTRLEQLGQLRHLRVTHAEDPATQVPGWWTLAPPPVGMNLEFQSHHRPYRISYPKIRSGYWTAWGDGLERQWNQTSSSTSWKLLSEKEANSYDLNWYQEFMETHNDSLRKVHLNDLYAQPDIVGKLLAQV